MSCSTDRLRQQGFTLLELLVVFLIVSLIATLLMQGFMYMAGIYGAVERRQVAARSEALVQGWLAESVKGLVNGVDGHALAERRFGGSGQSFRGPALVAITHSGGVTRPLEVEWAFQRQGEALALAYREWPLDTEPTDWYTVHRWRAGEGRFSYLVNGEWHNAFPPVAGRLWDESSPRLPDAIRLEVAGSRVPQVVIVRLEAGRLAYRPPRPEG